MKAIITGGGTGGHIYPALAVARELIKRDWEILYVGSKNSLEGRLIPEEGISYQEIDVSPLPRKISLEVLVSLIRTGKGLIQARHIIKGYRPDIVLGTGGFVSGPVLLAAALSRFKSVIHEQNVYPGLTNRILARVVDYIAINFADAERYFPSRTRSKLWVTGNPVRKTILETTRREGLKELKLEDKKLTLLVSGGSQGSMSINKAMIKLYQSYLDSSRVQIIHLTGEANYKEVLKMIEETGIVLKNQTHYKIIPYLKKMHLAYAVADLAIFRAGATGIAEITSRGIPAILIPYPYASGNHQEYNARSLTENGAAEKILDRELNGELLLEKVDNLLNDKEKLLKMKEMSLEMGQPDALEKLVSLIERVKLQK